MVQISKNNVLAGQFHLLFFMSSCSIVLFERGLLGGNGEGESTVKPYHSFVASPSLALLLWNFYFNFLWLTK